MLAIHRALCVILWVLGLVPFAGARELLAVSAEFPGIHFTAPDGTPRGLGVDVLRMIAAERGDQVRFEIYPWARAQKMVEEGRADVLVGPYRTAARERRFQFVEPGFYRDNLRFYVRRQSGYSWDGRVTSIQGRRIAIMHGWAYGARFDSLKPYLDLHVAPSVELAFKLLMAERVDLVASNERDSRPRIAELGLEGDVSPLEPVIDTQVGYLALPRGESHRPLREDIERILRRMRADGRLAELARPYAVPLP